MKQKAIYRGKTKLGIWVYGYYMYSELQDKHFILGESKDYGFQKEEVIAETVGQFTGKIDINGVKIFEGDDCKCRYYKHSECDLFLNQTVKFDNSCFYVVVKDETPNLETETYANCPLNWVDQIEVIGNIHDNSELLK